MNNPMQWLADRFADTIAEEGARVRAELQAGLVQTLNAARITGARPAPLQPNTRNANGRGRLVGWSLREAAGTPAPATVTVYGAADGSDPATIIATIPLTAGAGSTLPPSTPGVFYGEGIYVAVTGTVTGALYFAGTD